MRSAVGLQLKENIVSFKEINGSRCLRNLHLIVCLAEKEFMRYGYVPCIFSTGDVNEYLDYDIFCELTCNISHVGVKGRGVRGGLEVSCRPVPERSV